MWLYVPSACVPASEASKSEPQSFWETLSRSVTWRGKSPSPAFLRREWRTGRFQPLRFGLISQRSAQKACEDWWISLRLASPVPITRWRDSGQDVSGSTGRSGRTWPGLFAKWNPGSSSWRTYPEYSPLIEPTGGPDGYIHQASGMYSETWPKQGMMLSGSACLRPTWELRTRGRGGSASDGGRIWSTPTVDDRGAYRWQEPGPRESRMYPTPSARDVKGENARRHLDVARGRKHLDQLPNFLAHSPYSPLLQLAGSGPESSPSSHTLLRRLNPVFVAWLMGYPWWWTRTGPIKSARSGTQSYLSRLRLLLRSYLRGQGS